MDAQTDLLTEIARNTREIARLLAVALPRGFTAKLDRTFDSSQKRDAYSASDGFRSAREVARLADTTHPTVGRWWTEWLDKGLVEECDGGRMRALFDLSLLTLADRLEDM